VGRAASSRRRALESRGAGIAAQRQRHAIGTGGADERRAPHDHGRDGAHGIVEGPQLHEHELVGQARLVDDLDGLAIADGVDGSIVLAADLHRT
jgi:hypothetical protein